MGAGGKEVSAFEAHQPEVYPTSLLAQLETTVIVLRDPTTPRAIFVLLVGLFEIKNMVMDMAPGDRFLLTIISERVARLLTGKFGCYEMQLGDKAEILQHHAASARLIRAVPGGALETPWHGVEGAAGIPVDPSMTSTSRWRKNCDVELMSISNITSTESAASKLTFPPHLHINRIFSALLFLGHHFRNSATSVSSHRSVLARSRKNDSTKALDEKAYCMRHGNMQITKLP